MKRNAKQLKRQPGYADVAGHFAAIAGQKIANNPMVTGGSVAFAVVMFFVSSNALFYQPMAHKDAFFATRSMANYQAPDLPKPVSMVMATDRNTDTFAITDDSRPEVAAADPTLVDVQSALAQLQIYSGSIDGLSGPKTRAAIAKFQKQAGLEPTGEVDPMLIDAIRTASIPEVKVPTTKPKAPKQEAFPTNDSNGLSSKQISLIQAGLKSFGNDKISIDGKVGDDTVSAVREFQTLFEMDVTGQPDKQLLAKLKEIGLVAH